MDVQIKNIDDVTVIAIEGELDGKTAPVAQNEILPLAQPGCKLLVGHDERKQHCCQVGLLSAQVAITGCFFWD